MAYIEKEFLVTVY